MIEEDTSDLLGRNIPKRNSQFPGEIRFCPDVEHILTMLFHEVKVVEFIPYKEAIFNTDTLTAYFVVKRVRWDNCQCECQKSERKSDQHKEILGKKEENDFNGSENKKAIDVVFTGANPIWPSWGMP